MLLFESTPVMLYSAGKRERCTQEFQGGGVPFCFFHCFAYTRAYNKTIRKEHINFCNRLTLLVYCYIVVLYIHSGA